MRASRGRCGGLARANPPRPRALLRKRRRSAKNRSRSTKNLSRSATNRSRLAKNRSAKNRSKAARATVMYAPMLAILFVATRMRALQITQQKGPRRAGPRTGCTWPLGKTRTIPSPKKFGVAVETRRWLEETPPSTLLPLTDLPPSLAQGEEPVNNPP